MAAKLKSIINRIHWSLAVRAIAFSIAWLFAPFWFFGLVALYCYLIPSFRAAKLAVPFGTLLGLCCFQPPSLGMALIFGFLFYYLLLIKDLLLIDRRSGEALLTMALSFFLFREFYAIFHNGITGSALAAAFLVAGVFALLENSLTSPEILEDRSDSYDMKREASLPKTISFLIFLAMAQLVVAVLFLPLDFIYQSIIVFLCGVLVVDIVPEYFTGRLSFAKLKSTFAVIISLLVIILASARWSL